MTTSCSDHSRPAFIQMPSPAGDGNKRNIPCHFKGMEGKRLTLETIEPLAVSAVVSVEYEDALFLGEIVSCAEKEQAWNVQVKVEQILTGLQSLMLLRERLLNEGIPKPLGLVPIGARN